MSLSNKAVTNKNTKVFVAEAAAVVEFSTEVEHMPQNTEVVGSNPAICSSFYPLRHTFLNRFLSKVQVTYCHYKMEA